MENYFDFNDFKKQVEDIDALTGDIDALMEEVQVLKQSDISLEDRVNKLYSIVDRFVRIHENNHVIHTFLFEKVCSIGKFLSEHSFLVRPVSNNGDQSSN